MLLEGNCTLKNHPMKSLCLHLTPISFFHPTPDGIAAFRAFLKTEFSEENLDFWLACEEFKKIRSASKLEAQARRIFEEFVCCEAPKEVRNQDPPPSPHPLLFPLDSTKDCVGGAGLGSR